MSYKDIILEYMKLHDGYISVEIAQNLGCRRLSARIHELRVDGYNIKTVYNCGIHSVTGRPYKVAIGYQMEDKNVSK